MRTLRSAILLIFIAALFTGCTLEQRLASSFVKLDPKPQVYLLEPDHIFKYNLKEFELSGSDTMDQVVKDSLLLEKSLFLNTFSDSVVIERLMAGMISGLKRSGLSIIPESDMDSLLGQGGNPFILNLAQFTLEEYIHPYRSEEEVYDEIIVIDGIDVNAINFNLWIELGIMNSEMKNRVLFYSDFLMDKISGTLKQNLMTGKMSFDYSIDTISPGWITEFAYKFGTVSASYFYDYLLNEYIGEKLPDNYPYERYYYHFDPERRLIYPVDESERLTEIKE
ncbi:MAG TPA: hypothetical protein PKZ74_07980 [Bacteroidales bacterium]|nr:hypothetical protein [Bacteroidales bacterium]